MITGKDIKHTNVLLKGKCLEKVDIFKYLGVKISNKGYHDELNIRIGKATKGYGSLKKRCFN